MNNKQLSTTTCTPFSGNSNTIPFGENWDTFGVSTSSTPFGTRATPSPSPSGNDNADQGTVDPSTFGTSNIAEPSPFGNTGATAPVQSPYGSAGTSAQPASSSFGNNRVQLLLRCQILV